MLLNPESWDCWLCRKDGVVLLQCTTTDCSKWGFYLATSRFEPSLEVKKHVWVQIASGELLLNGNKLQVGDGAAVSEESVLKIRATKVQ